MVRSAQGIHQKRTLLNPVVPEPWLRHPVTEKSLEALALVEGEVVSSLVDSEWSLSADLGTLEWGPCVLQLRAQRPGGDFAWLVLTHGGSHVLLLVTRIDFVLQVQPSPQLLTELLFLQNARSSGFVSLECL